VCAYLVWPRRARRGQKINLLPAQSFLLLLRLGRKFSFTGPSFLNLCKKCSTDRFLARPTHSAHIAKVCRECRDDRNIFSVFAGLEDMRRARKNLAARKIFSRCQAGQPASLDLPSLKICIRAELTGIFKMQTCCPPVCKTSHFNFLRGGGDLI